MSAVLILSESAPGERGGVGRGTERIARLAAARGERVVVLAGSKKETPGALGQRRADGFDVFVVGKSDDKEHDMRALLSFAIALGREREVSLVHGVYATTGGYLATLVAPALSAASVVSLRGNDLDRAQFRAQDLPFLQHALTRADVVTSVSSALAEGARAHGRDDVVFINNTVDTERFQPADVDNSLRAALGLDGQVIGFLGELREKKGQRFLLPAFAKVAEARAASLLLIGGARPGDEGVLERFRAQAPELSERVIATPYRDDATHLARLLALCDVVVFPSLYDGMPNACLEAMACARPVLASDAGGLRDIITHEVDGAILPLSRISELPSAIEEMLDLPERQRRELGLRARETMRERFNVELESERWAAVYERARAAHSAS